MQHDTSPHRVEMGGRRRRVECAELILCYSRKLYAQVYLRWSRFECKAFLTEAIRYLGGAAARCVVDNSSVVLARGSGRDATVSPEMEAFSERFGFVFLAHEPGDKDRSGKVERNFHYIENNFYPGRSFSNPGSILASARMDGTGIRVFIVAATYVLISAGRLSWLGLDRSPGAWLGVSACVALNVGTPGVARMSPSH